MIINQLYNILFEKTPTTYLVSISMVYNYYKYLEKKYNHQINPFRRLNIENYLQANKNKS